MDNEHEPTESAWAKYIEIRPYTGRDAGILKALKDRLVIQEYGKDLTDAQLREILGLGPK